MPKAKRFINKAANQQGSSKKIVSEITIWSWIWNRYHYVLENWHYEY